MGAINDYLDNCIEVCSICGGPTGPCDTDSMLDTVGVYCGSCIRKLGLAGELILPCGLCRFPVLGEIFMIDGHDYEYCKPCYELLCRAGF